VFNVTVRSVLNDLKNSAVTIVANSPNSFELKEDGIRAYFLTHRRNQRRKFAPESLVGERTGGGIRTAIRSAVRPQSYHSVENVVLFLRRSIPRDQSRNLCPIDACYHADLTDTNLALSRLDGGAGLGDEDCFQEGLKLLNAYSPREAKPYEWTQYRVGNKGG
jgi:hypothetical protein